MKCLLAFIVLCCSMAHSSAQVSRSMAYRGAALRQISAPVLGDTEITNIDIASASDASSAVTRALVATGAGMYAVNTAVGSGSASVSDDQGDTFVAGPQVTAGGQVDQIFFCTNPISSATVTFTVTGSDVVANATTWGSSGTISFVAQTSPGAGATSTTSIQPGSLSAVGTNLFILGVSRGDHGGGMTANYSVDSSFVDQNGDTANTTDVSGIIASKLSDTAENPTVGFDVLSDAAVTMLTFKATGGSGGGGGFTYTLIAHIKVSADGSGIATSTAIDTTGANLLIYNLSWGKGQVIIADNKANGAPSALGIFGDSSGLRSNQLFYAINPTVGSGHTFTVAATNSSGYPVLQIYAFKKTGGTPALDGTGTGVSGDGSNTSSWSPGAQTPSGDNELFVMGLCTTTSGTLSTDSGYSSPDQDTTPSAGVMVGGFSYLIQTTGATVTPSFLVTSSMTKEGISGAMFK